MDKFLNYIKNHKKRVIIIAAVLIVFLALFLMFKKVYNYLSPSSKQSVYGDRCENVKAYPVKDDTKKSIKEAVESFEGVTLTKIDVKCKLIDIIINFDNDKEDTIVGQIGASLLNAIPENIRNNYDLELYITNSNKENQTYPRIGTHHKVIKGEANENFVW